MNTHKVYTREQLEALTANELDEIYFYLVGYRPMQDDNISRKMCIDLILGQYDEIEKHKPAPVSAHTAGPWVDNGRIIWKYSDREPLATVHNYSNDAELKANARLISLAPEMLEVLGACKPIIIETVEKWSNGEDSYQDILDKINSLLSRARQ